MEMKDIFLDASRMKLRFPSCRGELTTEQLWEVPLCARERHMTGFDLDTIARGVNSELREISEGSFVTTAPSLHQRHLEIALEVLKVVIATKQADAAKLLEAQQRKQQRAKLLDALAAKDAQTLLAASREDLAAQLAALEAE